MALSKILREPLLTIALDIVIRQAQPSGRDLTRMSPDAQASVANQLAGMSDLVRRLGILAEPTNPTPHAGLPEEEGEWGHLLDADSEYQL